MSEANQVQAETPPAASDVWRRQFYAPWMIGVLVVFVVCEVLFFTWGYNAAFHAQLGVVFAITLNGLYCWRFIRKGSSCIDAFVILTLLSIAAFLTLMLVVLFAYGALRRSGCKCNLVQLGFIIDNYESANKTFPPAFIANKKGQPINSWRTLLLPCLYTYHDREPYDFGQPWNTPDNQAILAKYCDFADLLTCPDLMDLPKRAKDQTDYVAVTGDDTLWPTDGTSRLREDIKVDPSTVGMVIEINNSDISWYEPRDMKLDDLFSGKASWNKTGVHASRQAFYYPVSGRNVLFADGQVHYLCGDLTHDQIRRLFSITEPFDVEAELSRKVERRPIVFRHIVFYVWLATLLLQFVYVFFPVEKRIGGQN